MKLTVNVTFDDFKEAKLPEAQLYVFDSQKRLVETKSMASAKGGKIEVELPKRLKNRKLKVVVGPRIHQKERDDRRCIAKMLPGGIQPEERVSTAMLLKRGGVEKVVRTGAKDAITQIKVVHEDLQKWIWCNCTVKGRLVKEFTLPDGTSKELGVCGACIYIWEVDTILHVIERLPDIELLRVRDELLELLEKWPPVPWPPDPWPPYVKEPDIPWYSQPDPVAMLRPDYTEVFRANVPVGKNVKLKASATRTELREAQKAIGLKKIEEFEAVFSAPSVVSLRREMRIMAQALIPYLCYLPWIYRYVTKDFLTCTCTDTNGYFEREITYACSGDKPDLYFTAHQCIDGNWVTLYNPGLPCHVHWNYICGTDVRLVTSEPGARVCTGGTEIDPPPGTTAWVEPHGIGGFNLSQINSQGRVNYYDGSHEIQNAPFGSTIGFKMGRSNTIPSEDVYYYRFQYRQGSSGKWHEFAAPVTRHYIHEENDEITFPVLTLGPVPMGSKHLYRFKPDTPKELNASLDATFDYWPEDNWFTSDQYSAYLNTPNLPGGPNSAHGLYQIKITVYNSDGNIVDPDKPDPAFKFIMPTAPDSASEATPADEAPDAYRDGEGFIFNISIDNRPCHAGIDLPVVGGEVIDETMPEGYACGFLWYEAGDDVFIAFDATQDGNNAEARFTLKRGYTKLDDLSMVRGEIATGLSGAPYNNPSDGEFSQTFSLTQLLGTCTNAAFAEHLYVFAKATNGWHRLSGYDASNMRAFALAKNEDEEIE